MLIFYCLSLPLPECMYVCKFKRKCMHVCSVTKSCLTLCNLMDWSTPGFPVLQYLWSLIKLMSIESLMLFNHLILCCPRQKKIFHIKTPKHRRKKSQNKTNILKIYNCINLKPGEILWTDSPPPIPAISTKYLLKR